MNDVKLTDYFPETDEISSETLQDVRDRIATYLQSRYEDSIDMAPNSVFGDLILSPLAYLIASFEIAASRLFSDIDLANVAEGQIYNCDFVKEYLDNFGLSQRISTPSTGVVRIIFSEPGSYILDASTSFVFSDDGENYVYAMADVTDFLRIEYNIPEGQEEENVRQLNRISENEYAINIPVVGPAGVNVFKNTTCPTNITIPQVTEVKSVTDFDPGVLPENVMELANKTRNTYYAASLASRNGCLSFLIQTYPELRGVSPVVSGDDEIHRTTENLFGVKQGVMDIHIKSKKNFVTETVTTPLAYNENLQRYVGLLTTNQGPPVRVRSVTMTGGIEPQEVEIVGKPSDRKKYPGFSCSYSVNESLGLYVKETNITERSQPSLTPDIIDITDVGQIQATGNFLGHPFITGASRNITLTFSGYNSDQSVLNATLDHKGSIVEITFDRVSLVDDVASFNLNVTPEYDRFCKGVAFNINISSKLADLQDKLDTLLEDENKSHIFTVKPESNNFLVTYEYDPTVLAVNNFVARSDIRPINTDLQVRNFLACEVKNMVITYRSKSGSLVDLNNAKNDIVSYVNGLSYPNLYESFAVAEIMLYYGADGVSNVAQQGIFSRTVANKYLDTEKSINDVVEGNLFIDQMKNEYVDAYDIVETIETTTLRPPEGIQGIGERNIHYLLDGDNIVFDEVSF